MPQASLGNGAPPGGPSAAAVGFPQSPIRRHSFSDILDLETSVRDGKIVPISSIITSGQNTENHELVSIFGVGNIQVMVPDASAPGNGSEKEPTGAPHTTVSRRVELDVDNDLPLPGGSGHDNESKCKGLVDSDTVILRVLKRERPKAEELHKVFRTRPVTDVYNVVSKILKEPRPEPVFTCSKGPGRLSKREIMDLNAELLAALAEAENEPDVVGLEVLDAEYQFCEREPVEELSLSSPSSSSSTDDTLAAGERPEWIVDGKLLSLSDQQKYEMEMGPYEDFNVSKSTLANIEGAEFFDRLLNGPFADNRDDRLPVMVYDQDLFGMKTVLLSIHNATFEGTFACKITQVFDVLRTFDSLAMDLPLGGPWFDHWYSWRLKNIAPTPHQAAALLAPAFHFDARKSFMRLSRYVVYFRNNGQYLMEERLFQDAYRGDDPRLELPPHILQQLDMARGRIKNQITQGIEFAKSMLLDRPSSSQRKGNGTHSPIPMPYHVHHRDKCIYKCQTVGVFHKALTDQRITPVNYICKHESIDEILVRLHRFRMPDIGCPECNDLLVGMLIRIADHIRRYFEGLCIDCMEKEDDDHPLKDGFVTSVDFPELWLRSAGEAQYRKKTKKHVKRQKMAWCKGCRVPHGNATWYFSWMCRTDMLYRRLANSIAKAKLDAQIAAAKAAAATATSTSTPAVATAAITSVAGPPAVLGPASAPPAVTIPTHNAVAAPVVMTTTTATPAAATVPGVLIPGPTALATPSAGAAP